MPAQTHTPSKDEVLKAFKTLTESQKHLALYRVLLQRYVKNKNIKHAKRSEYDILVPYRLALKGLFLRRKNIEDIIRPTVENFELNNSVELQIDLLLAFDNKYTFDNLFKDNYLSNLLNTEIEYVKRHLEIEGKTNHLFVNDLSVEGMNENPFLRFLYDSSIDEEYVNKFYNVLKNISSERLKSSSLDVLNKYFIEALDDNLDSINVARVIVLGNGSAGKTSLIKKIINKRYNSIKEKMTPRIEISHQKIDKVEVDYWDFGGQVFMHSTHTFFMTTKATYVIVCNARADEQPDDWLELLKNTLGEDSKIRVLIVYTFVDTKDESENFDKYRKNILDRKYAARFELSFHLHSSRYVNDTVFKEFKDELNSTIEIQGSQKTFKQIESLYKDAQETFISAKNIYDKHRDFISGDDGTKLIKELLLMGYIFPLVPLKEKEYTYHENDIFVWQKHWLTYGVYEIINHNITKKKCGFVTKNDFREMLFNNKTRYILQNGSLKDRKPWRKNFESIVYNDEGINILYQIILNYNWAIVNNKRQEEIIFPHAVELDEPTKEILNKYNYQNDSSVVLTVLFDYIPVGFFFQFITLAKAHIDEPSLLWRSGVVLFEQNDNETFGYIQMYTHKMKIILNGKNKNFLMRAILEFIARLERDSKHRKLSPKVMQHVKLKDEDVTVDIALISSILDTDSNTLTLIKDVLKNTGSINFFGDVDLQGGVVGDNGAAKTYNTRRLKDG